MAYPLAGGFGVLPSLRSCPLNANWLLIHNFIDAFPSIRKRTRQGFSPTSLRFVSTDHLGIPNAVQLV